MNLFKTIVVLSSATRFSGSYMIYKQFINHLADNINGYKYYIFIDPEMYHPQIDGVEYIYESNHSWCRRIYMDQMGWNNVLKRKGINPDLIISLQNTAMITKLPQIIYYHTSLSFYPNKWNPLKKNERGMFLYKYIFPFFVKRTLSNKTHVIVQIPFIKEAFMQQFHWPEKMMHVMFPDLERIDVNSIQSDVFTHHDFHFLYPATPLPYKQHLTIVRAVKLLKQECPEIGEKVRIHFTIKPEELLDLYKFVRLNNLDQQIIFHGKIPHEKLQKMYKSSVGLLFPSTIETIGLPLLEAARFGLPIVASDVDYAKEVLDGYNGVVFVSYKDYTKWAELIKLICKNKSKYPSFESKPSSWPLFFKLIDNILNNNRYSEI